MTTPVYRAHAATREGLLDAIGTRQDLPNERVWLHELGSCPVGGT